MVYQSLKKLKSPNTALRFSNIIICKDKKTFEKLHADTKSRLKKYFIQKNLTLHEKWNFSLRISSVNLTKFAVSCRLVTFTEEILYRKLHLLCLINKDDLKVNHPGIKKLDLNRKSYSIFARNLLNFIEGYLNCNYEGDLFHKENCVSNDPTVSHSYFKNALKGTLMQIWKSVNIIAITWK